MSLNMEGQGQPTVIDCPTLKYYLFNLHYQSTIKLSKGQFIVRHIRPNYGFMLP